ncbi:MAG: M67 family metallopeptidase [Chlorobiaceae bacterium]|jgi:proteasome lid subunit RPN8/RPN11|nr:M67 family metallopeptidase [Chlorobiaceae bacterium]
MKLFRRPFEIIQEHAVRDMPYECCGLLAGKRNVDHRGNIENVVYEIAPCNNCLYYGKEHGFEISHQEYLAVEREAESMGFVIVGSYHSHIGSPAVPSRHDIDFAKPGHSMLIISLLNSEPKAVTAWFRRESGGFHQEQIRVVE